MPSWRFLIGERAISKKNRLDKDPAEDSRSVGDRELKRSSAKPGPEADAKGQSEKTTKVEPATASLAPILASYPGMMMATPPSRISVKSRTPHCATQKRRQCGAQHRTSEAERYIGAARMAERLAHAVAHYLTFVRPRVSSRLLRPARPARPSRPIRPNQPQSKSSRASSAAAGGAGVGVSCERAGAAVAVKLVASIRANRDLVSIAVSRCSRCDLTDGNDLCSRKCSNGDLRNQIRRDHRALRSGRSARLIPPDQDASCTSATCGVTGAELMT